MFTQLRIAFRNLLRQKKRTLLLGGAIAFGILIVTLINGIAGSFSQNVNENFSHLLAGHLFLEGIEKTDSGSEVELIRDDSELLSLLDQSGIPYEFITKRSSFNGEVIFQGNSVPQQIEGVSWSDEIYLTSRLNLVEGSFEELAKPNENGVRDGIVITQTIAEKLKVQLGDTVTVKMETIYRQRNAGEFRVLGISFDPGLFGNISAYADLDYVSQLLGLPSGSYQRMGIFVDQLTLMDPYADTYFESLERGVQMFERAPRDADRNPVLALFDQAEEEDWDGTRYRIFTLNDILEFVQQTVETLDGAAIVILLVLFLIIMVGITNTFRIIMYERIKEIGTMRALGMQRIQVASLFLLEAILLAFFGTLAGMLIAAIAMAIISSIYVGLDTPLYLFLNNGFFSFSLRPLSITINFLLVSFLTVLAAYFPARKAALMQPVNALQSTV
jgi:putative ABC transport system permease protein